jgi:predicted DNA-binding protein
MPTTKRRINLTLPETVEHSLVLLSRKAKVPIATKALDLLEEALEIHEDQYFGELALKRMKKKGRLLSHEEVWK